MAKKSLNVKFCVIQKDTSLSPFGYFCAPVQWTDAGSSEVMQTRAEAEHAKAQKTAQNLRVTLTVST